MSPENAELLRRREVLRRAAWLLGGAISAPAALAILQGCSARQQDGAAPATALKFFNPAQFAIVAEITEIMLPKTDTAGAREAGVPTFIDAALAGVYSQEAQVRFQAGCDEFEAAIKASGKPFPERDPGERATLVTQALLTAPRHPYRAKALHPHDPRACAAGILQLAGGHHGKYGVRSGPDRVPRLRAVVAAEETRLLGITATGENP